MSESFDRSRETVVLQDDEIDLAQLWGILYSGKWVVLACAVLALLVALIYVWMTPPVYRATAVIQMTPWELPGEMPKTFADADQQMQVIVSKPFMRRVAEKLNLNIDVAAKTLPLVDALLGHDNRPSLEITQLTAPAALLNQALTLSIASDGSFVLYGPSGTKILSGRAGRVASGKTATGQAVDIAIRHISVSAPHTNFTVIKKPWDDVIDDFRKRLKLSNNNGTIQISIEGQQSRKIAMSVNTMVKAYLAYSREMQADRVKTVLGRLKQQLQRINKDLDSAKSDLAQYQQQFPNAGLNTTTQSMLSRVEHLDSMRAPLLREQARLQVVRSEDVALNARVVNDAEVPRKPVGSKATLVLALALILGVVLGCGVIFLRAAVRRVVNDPRDIEHRFGLPVYAVIPYSKRLARPAWRAARDAAEVALLVREYPADAATEALRGLRTSLCANSMDTGSSISLLTGVEVADGRNFVAANLGYLLAEAGKTAVVVDADMRRGKLHAVVNQGRTPGLSDVLVGRADYRDALKRIAATDCFVVPCGAAAANPAELLVHERFHQLLVQLQADFDHVLVIAPPILAVTDGAVIAGTMPDICTFLIARSGEHKMEAIEESIKRIQRGRGRVTGVIFNGLKKSHADRAGGLAFYRYEYRSRS